MQSPVSSKNTTQQDNAGHIPKALWEQLPPHAKVQFQMVNAIVNNRLVALQPTQMIMLTMLSLVPYLCTPLALHHMPMETALLVENLLLYLSLYYHLHAVLLVTLALQMLPVVMYHSLQWKLYNVAMAHMTKLCLQVVSYPIGSLIDGGANVRRFGQC